MPPCTCRAPLGDTRVRHAELQGQRRPESSDRGGVGPAKMVDAVQAIMRAVWPSAVPGGLELSRPGPENRWMGLLWPRLHGPAAPIGPRRPQAAHRAIIRTRGPTHPGPKAPKSAPGRSLRGRCGLGRPPSRRTRPTRPADGWPAVRWLPARRGPAIVAVVAAFRPPGQVSGVQLVHVDAAGQPRRRGLRSGPVGTRAGRPRRRGPGRRPGPGRTATLARAVRRLGGEPSIEHVAVGGDPGAAGAALVEPDGSI